MAAAAALEEKKQQAKELQRQIQEEEVRVTREGWEEVARKLSYAFDNVNVKFLKTPQQIDGYHNSAMQFGRVAGTDTVFRFVWKDRLVKYGRYETQHGFSGRNQFVIFPGKVETKLPADASEAMFTIGGDKFREAKERVMVAKNQELFTDDQLQLMFNISTGPRNPEHVLDNIRWYAKPKHQDDLPQDAARHHWRRLVLKQTVTEDAE